MPLPQLPANNTDRAWLKYTARGIEHEAVFRFPNSTPQATIVTQLTTWANSMKQFLATTDSFTGLRHQDSGSSLSFPLAWTNVAGTGTAGTEKDDEAKYWSITGRSLDGYRCKLTFYYAIADSDDGYRVQGGSTLLTATTAISPAVVSVSGAAIIFNQYLNKGYNAYWQRQLR